MINTMEASIRSKINSQLNPVYFECVNESYKHNVPKGSESHFKVVIVSDKFENLSLLKQHQLVNTVLAEELKTGVHALAIKTMTLQKWKDSEEATQFSTPNCQGGDKKKSSNVSDTNKM